MYSITVRTPLLIIAMLWLALSQAFAAGLPDKLEEGFHYETINPPLSTKGAKAEIIELFNFKCPHCNLFHPDMAAWSNKNKDKYTLLSAPIFWGKQTDAPVRAYFAAAFLGKGEEMKDALFKAQFDTKENIEDQEVLNKIAVRIGLSTDKFAEAMRSFGVSGKLAWTNAITTGLTKSKLQISTPALIINGRYRITPDHSSGDWGTLLAIAERLAAQ